MQASSEKQTFYIACFPFGDMVRETVMGQLVELSGQRLKFFCVVRLVVQVRWLPLLPTRLDPPDGPIAEATHSPIQELTRVAAAMFRDACLSLERTVSFRRGS